MDETLQRLRNNSYHLAIRSSLLAIQSTLSLQETMLQSQYTNFTDIKSTIVAQNTTLQNTTRTLVEYFSKISTFQTPPPPTLGSAAPLLTSPPPENSSTANPTTPAPPTVPAAPNPQPPLPLSPAPPTLMPATVAGSTTSAPPSSKPPTPPLRIPSFTSTFDQPDCKLLNSHVRVVAAVPETIMTIDVYNSATELQHYQICNGPLYSAAVSIDARNMFVEMIKPLELSFLLAIIIDNNAYLHLVKLLSNPNITSAYLQNMGERKPLIFDPGGDTAHVHSRARIHPVFHITSLKLWHMTTTAIPSSLTTTFINSLPTYHTHLLEHKTTTTASSGPLAWRHSTRSYLKNSSLTTHPSFPTFDLEDKVAFRAGGNDTAQSDDATQPRHITITPATRPKRITKLHMKLLDYSGDEYTTFTFPYE